MIFGERLQAIRELKQLTLEQLSKRSQLGVATLFRYQQMADAGAIAYDALGRLAAALEVDIRYLTGENPELNGLDPSQVAARESLRRFLDAAAITPRLQRWLLRLQDDPAAPKTISDWQNFWRLVQRFSGKNDPQRNVDTASNEPRLHAVGSSTQLKSSARHIRRNLRSVA